MSRQFQIESLCRASLGALIALALTGAAAAEDYDRRDWLRLETSFGIRWVFSADLESARASRSAVKRLALLDPQPAQPADGSLILFAVHLQAYDCPAGAVREAVLAYRAVGQPVAEFSAPEQPLPPEALDRRLFDVVCRGAQPLEDIEVGSIQEVLDYDAMARERGWNGEPRG
jgi:hypothetical protein